MAASMHKEIVKQHYDKHVKEQTQAEVSFGPFAQLSRVGLYLVLHIAPIQLGCT